MYLEEEAVDTVRFAMGFSGNSFSFCQLSDPSLSIFCDMQNTFELV